MKELSIEEKAQAYDKVVNKLKGFMAQGVDPLITRADVQDFFPKLAESEDERIRKMIINTLNRDKILTEDEAYDCVTWLEKQGEQKHQYKSRPRYIGEEELLGEQVESSVQNKHWKPSDEQIKSLWELMRYAPSLSVYTKIQEDIESLYQDLKKLKG